MRRSLRAKVSALAVLSTMVTLGAATVVAGSAHADTTTVSNDLQRDGWYPDEPTLTSSSIASTNFGQLFSATVNGQVFAQPLVINGTLLVATENNNAYGLDPRTGAQLWTDNFGPPFVPGNFFDPHNQCGDIAPNVGVTSTPVVDPSTGTEYLTSKTYLPDGKTPVYYMHALSVSTGQEQAGWPVMLSGTADNAPQDTFNAGYELQRPGLLLTGGVVYATFGAHCDNKFYEGWVMGVSTSTAAITARWSAEAAAAANDLTGPGAGIWESGEGPVSDGTGQMIFATGNGETLQSPTPGSTPPANLGQSVVRLTAQSNGSLQATDFFAPYNAGSLNANDTDLGSAGPVELPSPYFGTAAHPNIIVQSGKSGEIYLLDAGNLGGFQQGPSGADAVINVVQGRGVWGHPGVWPGDGGYVYFTTAQGGKGAGSLIAYKYGLDGNGNPILAQAGRAADSFGFSSSSPMVTSSGATSGSALLWTNWAPDATGANAQLRAYNPVPVNGVLQLVRSFSIGTSTKFTPPIADHGTIYTGTLDGHVLAFGSPINAPITGEAVSFPTTTVGNTATATATITANQAVTVNTVSTGTSTVFTVGTPTPALPAALAAGQTLTIPLTFAPSGGGLAAGTLAVGTSLGSSAVPLSGQGQTAGPSLAVDAIGGLSFGGVQDGTSSSQTVTLTNQGAATLTIAGETVPGAPYSLNGLPVTGATIAGGQSVTATITFAPLQIGEYTNNLIIDSDGGNINVPIDGSGGTPPALQISNTSLEYGSVPEGVTAPLTFTLTNSGGTVLTIEKSKPPSNDNGFNAVNPDPEGSSINPGQTLTETVDYTATAIGDQQSAWTINANDGGGVRTVTFDGTGTAAPTPTLVVGDADVTQPPTGTATANFPVTLDPGALSPVTDTVKTGDGSLKTSSGAYVKITVGSVTVTPGAASTVPVTVNAASPPVNGSFYLDAGATPAAIVADNGKAYVNATPTTHNFVIANAYSVWRNPSVATTVEIPVTLQSPAAGAVTVTANTTDGTAVAGTDYTAVTNQTVTIPAGQSEAGLAVTLAASTDGQSAPLTFTVTLSGTSGLTKLAVPAATVTIYPPSANVTTPPANSAPVFTSASPGTTATVGGGYSYNFAASGPPTPSFSVPEGGSLPPGLTLDPTGTLAGTPTTAGTYTFSVTATNSVGSATTPAITITVSPPPSQPVFVKDTPKVTATVGTPYAYTYVANGSPDPTYSLASGGLPPGLSLTSSTGLVNGTPTATGTFTFVIEADNGIDAPVDSPPATITVNPAGNAPTITSAASAAAQVGQALGFTVTTTGTPTPAISETGALPAGVSFTDNGDGTATLSGTPATGTQGSYPITIGATNGTSPDASQAFTLTVTPAPAAPAFTSPTSATVRTGQVLAFTVATTGSPTPTVSETGALPSGVSFTANADGTASLSGSPVAGSQGTYPITFSATNGVSPDASQSFTLTVTALSADVSATMVGPSSATHGVSFVLTLTVSNAGPNPATGVQGTVTLPSGVSYVSSSPTGTVTGSVVTWSTGNLASGNHNNYKVTVIAASAGTPVFQAAVTATTSDPNSANNTVNLTIKVK